MRSFIWFMSGLSRFSSIVFDSEQLNDVRSIGNTMLYNGFATRVDSWKDTDEKFVRAAVFSQTIFFS